METYVRVLSPRAKLSQIPLLPLFKFPANRYAVGGQSPSVPCPSWEDLHDIIKTFLSDDVFPSESGRRDTSSRDFTHSAENTSLSIYQMHERLPLLPSALEDCPSVRGGSRCKPESIIFGHNSESRWALARRGHHLQQATGKCGPQLASRLFLGSDE